MSTMLKKHLALPIVMLAVGIPLIDKARKEKQISKKKKVKSWLGDYSSNLTVVDS